MKKAILAVSIFGCFVSGCKKEKEDHRNQYTGVYEFHVRYRGNYDTAAVYTPFDTSYITYGKVFLGVGDDALLITNAGLSSVMVTVFDDDVAFADPTGVVHGNFYAPANKMDMTFEGSNPVSVTEVVGYKQ